MNYFGSSELKGNRICRNCMSLTDMILIYYNAADVKRCDLVVTGYFNLLFFAFFN